MLIQKWFSKLELSKHDKAFFERQIADEFKELKEAKGLCNKWSELSDIVFNYARGRFDNGIQDLEFPLPYLYYYIGLVYGYPKFTLRWLFFKRVGKKFGVSINELRNWKKVEKLKKIAQKYKIPELEFIEEVHRISKWHIFIP